MTRMFERRLAVVVTIASLGCGGPTEPFVGELSHDEAGDLAAAVMFATFNSTSVVPPVPDGVSTAQQGWAADFEAEVRCPGGGRVGVAASIAVRAASELNAGVADYRLRQIHVGCEMGSPADRTFELWGDPRMNASVTVQHAGPGAVTWSGTADGAIEWARDRRRGRCAFSVRFTGEQNGAAGEADLEGTVCGHDIDRSAPIE